MDPFVFMPYVFLTFGVLSLIFPTQIGVGFCRLGKFIWRTVTFGLTDMRWFYPEDRAPTMFRVAGVFGVLVGLGLLGFQLGIGRGPNSFTAMSQARAHLKATYGGSSTYHLTARENTIDPENPAEGHCLIQYEYGEHKGTLVARWTKDERFVFEELATDTMSPDAGDDEGE